MNGNRKFLKGIFCYACGIKNAEPRDIGGTIYFLCDECFEQHQIANLKAVEYMRSKNMKKNYRNDQMVKKKRGNASDPDKVKEAPCPVCGCSST
ncbi:MAG: hypothetical protein ACOX2E_05090 [Syntrophaceticus sp.]|jgi:hypothetical protein